MRSLIPALSYMHDLLFTLKSKSRDALSHSDAGDHEAAAMVAMDTTIACAKQTDAIIQHMMEPLAVLRRLAQGNDEELALYNGMYNEEHTRAGQLGRTEALVEASVSSGVTRNLIAASARAMAQKALPRNRTFLHEEEEEEEEEEEFEFETKLWLQCIQLLLLLHIQTIISIFLSPSSSSSSSSSENTISASIK